MEPVTLPALPSSKTLLNSSGEVKLTTSYVRLNPVNDRNCPTLRPKLTLLGPKFPTPPVVVPAVKGFVNVPFVLSPVSVRLILSIVKNAAPPV
jgi:hypothetical protein